MPLYTKMIEKKIAKQVADIPKVKEMTKKIRSKLASKSLVLMIKNLNFSLVVRKTLTHDSYLNQAKSHQGSNALGQRFELMNLSVGDYEMDVSLAVD